MRPFSGRRSGRDRPIPKRPYRDSIVLYGVLAVVIVVFSAVTGGDLVSDVAADPYYTDTPSIPVQRMMYDGLVAMRQAPGATGDVVVPVGVRLNADQHPAAEEVGLISW